MVRVGARRGVGGRARETLVSAPPRALRLLRVPPARLDALALGERERARAERREVLARRRQDDARGRRGGRLRAQREKRLVVGDHHHRYAPFVRDVRGIPARRAEHGVRARGDAGGARGELGERAAVATGDDGVSPAPVAPMALSDHHAGRAEVLVGKQLDPPRVARVRGERAERAAEPRVAARVRRAQLGREQHDVARAGDGRREKRVDVLCERARVRDGEVRGVRAQRWGKRGIGLEVRAFRAQRRAAGDVIA